MAEAIEFVPVGEGEAEDDIFDRSTSATLALMAVCVKWQQDAGFGHRIDLREAPCPTCGAPGYNTGWGVWRHTCGAEEHADGEVATPCQKTAPSPAGEDR